MLDHMDQDAQFRVWVAANVRAAIETAGTTQTATALAAGIPSTTWKRRINGASPFDLDELAAIAKHLDVSPADLTRAPEQVPA